MRSFDFLFILKVIPSLLPGLKITGLMVLWTVIFGSFFGFFLAKFKEGKNKFLKNFANTYTYVIRSTPSIILLFIVYYGLPELLNAITGIDFNNYSRLFFVVITFTLFFSASMSEVMRSAYNSIDKGQREAAVSIGLTDFQAFYRIVLPQCMVVALPNLSNSLILLMKEGALGFTIGLIDVMGKGNLIIGKNYGAYALETYIALAIIYWTLTIIIEKSFMMLEKKLSKGTKLVSAN
ncbi:MAG: amino acid ABC transporter permease [Treponema sp. CETP13]|nr:MAG: amino acid ABC transporter permease [Treponema sp. CETP13]